MGYPIYHSQYTAAQIEASIGKTPRIKSSTRTWEIWDIATSAYVDTGVSIDTQLYVDPTLTESGYAADAKVTGDKIGELKNAISKFADTNGYTVQENYIVSASTGAIVASETNHPYAISDVVVTAGTTVQLALDSVPIASGRGACFYDAQGTALSGEIRYVVDQLTYTATAPTGAVKFAFTVFGASDAYQLVTVKLPEILANLTKLNAADLLNLKRIDGRVTSSDSPYYNPDNVPTGTVISYAVSGTGLPANNGTLFTFSGSSTYYKTQIYVAKSSNTMYYRAYNDSAWATWQTVPKTSDLTALEEKCLSTVGRRVTSSDDPYYDANNVPPMMIVAYGGGTNVPSLNGTLMCFEGDSTYYKSQIFISTPGAGNLYFRKYNNSVWSDWIQVAKASEIDTLIKRSDYYCTMALFPTVGVLGDSYASGAFGESPSATVAIDHYNVSWPQIMARRNGITVTNYTRGGASTRSFITDNDRGLPKLLSDTAQDLYILALERNDYNIENGGESGYLGSIDDITDHSLGDYPDTFYGNYATIIENLLTHAPDAKIVMMVGDYTSTNVLGTAYNAAVVEIAEHYGLPYMAQLEDSYFSDPYYRQNWPAGQHPSAIIYAGMELAIERMLQKCVATYKSYFNYFNG